MGQNKLKKAQTSFKFFFFLVFLSEKLKVYLQKQLSRRVLTKSR